MNDLVKVQENLDLPSMALSIWRVLWKARNNLIFKGVTISPINVSWSGKKICTLLLVRGTFKNDPSRSKVLGLLESYSNNILLIFTGKSSFGYPMMLNNSFVWYMWSLWAKTPFL